MSELKVYTLLPTEPPVVCEALEDSILRYEGREDLTVGRGEVFSWKDMDFCVVGEDVLEQLKDELPPPRNCGMWAYNAAMTYCGAPNKKLRIIFPNLWRYLHNNGLEFAVVNATTRPPRLETFHDKYRRTGNRYVDAAKNILSVVPKRK